MSQNRRLLITILENRKYVHKIGTKLFIYLSLTHCNRDKNILCAYKGNCYIGFEFYF